jgi:hypothetical protein
LGVFIGFLRIFLLGILIFKGLTARRTCKFGVKGLMLYSCSTVTAEGIRQDGKPRCTAPIASRYPDSGKLSVHLLCYCITWLIKQCVDKGNWARCWPVEDRNFIVPVRFHLHLLNVCDGSDVSVEITKALPTENSLWSAVYSHSSLNDGDTF